jgi:hypothetical protein
MALHKLVTNEDGGRPSYVEDGDFTKMIYFCPDIRYNYLKKGTKDQYVEKTNEELERELKHYLISLSIASFNWVERKVISDYWLVVTPQVCDHLTQYNAPSKDNNYIVTPFYTDDIELVRLLYTENDFGYGYGSVEVSPDKRKRKGSNAVIGFYLACEINDESENFKDAQAFEKGTPEYTKKVNELLLTMSLNLGSDLTDFMGMPIRAFIQYGKNKSGIQFVEQNFDSKASKKTKGWSLGEGYLRNLLGKVNEDKNYKYVAFEDLFESTGNDFCDYALSKDEMRSISKSFEDNSWLPRPEFIEDEQSKTLLEKDF